MIKKGLSSLLIIILSLVIFIGGSELILGLIGVKPLSQDAGTSMWDSFALELNQCVFDEKEVERLCSPRHDLRKDDYVMIDAFGGSSLVWSADPGEPSFIDLTNQKLENDGVKIRLINYGSSCKDSEFIKDCAQAIKPYSSGPLFIYSGHNDFCNLGYVSTERGIFLRRTQVPQKIAFFLQDQSRLYTLVSKALRWVSFGESRVANLRVDELKEAEKKVISFYIENLKSIIEENKKTNTQIILATVVSNIHDIAPMHNFKPKPALASAGVQSLELFDMAQNYFHQGEYQIAFDHFKKARDLDPMGYRATSALNKSIRQLASHYDHVKLIDIEKFFKQEFITQGWGCNLFGSDLYCDHVHPNLLAKKKMASYIAEQLKLIFKESKKTDSF